MTRADVLKGLELVCNIGRHLSTGRFSLLDWRRAIVFRRQVPSPSQLESVAVDRSDRTVLFRLRGHEFWWPSEFPTALLTTVWAEVFVPYPPNGHYYEFDETRIISGDWVLDLGAGEGFFVQFALQRGANVVAVEPVPRAAHCLRKTFSDEIEAGRVRVVNAFAGEEEGFATPDFLSDPLAATRSRLGKGEVAVATIDEMVRSLGIPSVDFVKMDIEGDEQVALRGAEDTITCFAPKLSICVYHFPEQQEEVVALLERFRVSYELVSKGWKRHGSDVLKQTLHGSPAVSVTAGSS